MLNLSIKTAGHWKVVCLALALGVFLQMLGVPVTLLNPIEMEDISGSSILEAFSIPPLLPQLTISPKSVAAIDPAFLFHVSLLPSTLFHPPLT